MRPIQIGDRVRDGLGHWYRVIGLRADGWQVQVENEQLKFICWMGRSEVRTDGE